VFERTQQEVMKNWVTVDQPVLSVCCITYNHENYIAEALDSFLMQETNFPFEVIVRDDCSIDQTAMIIRDYANQYPDIIKPIYEAENQYSKGVSPTSVVFKKTKGDYIAICEGDDYWTDKNKLQKQVDFLRNNPDFVITYTDSQPFNEKGFIKEGYGGATKDLSSVELMKATSLYTLTTCFRNVVRELPEEFKFLSVRDIVIWSLLGKYGKGKYLSDIKPAAYRVHDGGVFSKKSAREKEEMKLLTYVALFAYYKKENNVGVVEYFKLKILNSIVTSMGKSGLYKVFLLKIRDRIIRELNKIYRLIK